jgi:hypothetical protein
MKFYCWTIRTALIVAGGLLIVLASFLMLELEIFVATFLGIFIGIFTYRFSAGYRSNIIGVGIVTVTCLVTSLWIGILHFSVCKGIQIITNSANISNCADCQTRVIVSGALSFMLIGAVTMALTIGKHIAPIAES